MPLNAWSSAEVGGEVAVDAMAGTARSRTATAHGAPGGNQTMLQASMHRDRTTSYQPVAHREPSAVASVPTNDSAAPAFQVRNRLLSSLPVEELAKLQPHLESVTHSQRDLLMDQDGSIDYVYFPETMVISLVSALGKGDGVEVGTAGFEGMVGLPLFLGDKTSSMSAFVQIPGTAMRIDTAAFMEAARVPGPLNDIMLRYTMAFLTQLSQTAACNGTHLVHERCARWLLTTHDRVAGDRFPLTHHFLAFMLGVRRAGVTMAMGVLQSAGTVKYSRGWVQIMDRAQLERASCACYGMVRAHSERLLPQVLA